MNNLILATGNAHKVEEFTQILVDWNVLALGRLIPGFPEPEETAPDFLGNSRIKALAALSLLPEGSTVVADDSGLEVPLLGGEPGVYSARFAQRAGNGQGDAANRNELVRRLVAAGLSGNLRTPAAFACALTFLSPEREIQVIGHCHGEVGLEERGDHGFGYDALFYPTLKDGTKSLLTFAQMTAQAKHDLSHRGIVLGKLARALA